MKSENLLRLVLTLTGLSIIALGINVALGGILTLGWQTSGSFVVISDERLFRVHDSHTRFLGGVWLSIGVLFVLGAIYRDRLRATLIVLSLSIACAGLFRLSGTSILSSEILTSFLLEIIAFPALAAWLSWSERQRSKS